MVDWSLPFEESMLDAGRVIISCPDGKLVKELFELFVDHGIAWPGGLDMTETYWERERSVTCYHVFADKTLKRANTDFYSASGYNDNIRCTFRGVGPALEIPDTEFETIISAGGVDKGGSAHVG